MKLAVCLILLCVFHFAHAQSTAPGSATDLDLTRQELQKIQTQLTPSQRQALISGAAEPVFLDLVSDLSLQKLDGNCSEADYQKLKTQFDLKVLKAVWLPAFEYTLRLQQEGQTLRQEHFFQLLKQGQIKVSPKVLPVLELRKAAFESAVSKQLRLKMEANHKDSLKRAETRLFEAAKKYSLGLSPFALAQKLQKLAPACFEGNQSLVLNSILEKERMKIEGPLLLQKMKDYQAKTGVVEANPYTLGLATSSEDFQNRDGWGHEYLVQKEGRKITLRSLGPDGFLSDDDVIFGSFEMVDVKPQANKDAVILPRAISKEQFEKLIEATTPLPKFEVVGIESARSEKFQTSLGESKVTGYFIESPKSEQKLKSPVLFKVGFQIEGKNSLEALPTHGRFFIDINSFKDSAHREVDFGKRKFLYFERGHRELSVPLSSGTYRISTGYADDSQKNSLGGWISDSYLITVE